MAEEKAYQLGKKLGAASAEATAAEKQQAEERLAWSRAQGEAAAEHRTAVQKG